MVLGDLIEQIYHQLIKCAETILQPLIGTVTQPEPPGVSNRRFSISLQLCSHKRAEPRDHPGCVGVQADGPEEEEQQPPGGGGRHGGGRAPASGGLLHNHEWARC